jgi:hypothetical protein
MDGFDEMLTAIDKPFATPGHGSALKLIAGSR